MLKTATAILLVGLLFGAVYSLVLVVSPQTIANSTLEARTQMKLESVQDQPVAETIVGQTRYLGVFALATNISAFFIVQRLQEGPEMGLVGVPCCRGHRLDLWGGHQWPRRRQDEPHRERDRDGDLAHRHPGADKGIFPQEGLI
jgi:hypothetical protein